MSLDTAIADHIVPVCGIVFGVGYLAIWTVAEEYRKMRNSEHTAVLKRTMIEKGFSSEEIIAVIRAFPGQNSKCQHHKKPEQSPVS
jgi:hypothetical protein